MTLRKTPRGATLLLRLFCSDARYEAVIGDLTEQYQQGRSSFWYWKQVAGIVVFGGYGRTAQRPQSSRDRPRIGSGFAAVFLIAGLVAAILSGLWILLLVPILLGLMTAGVLSFLRDDDVANTLLSDAPARAGIDSSKIPVTGGTGAAIVIVMLLSAVAYELPAVRALAAPGMLFGVLFGLTLHAWRKLHPPAPRVTTLGLKAEIREGAERRE